MPAHQILIENRKARHKYTVLETLEAGIALTGSEVKSAKNGGINLSDAYAIVKNEECFLLNCHIAPYAYDYLRAGSESPTRTRKLLLHKKEISRLLGKIKTKGLTLVPLQVYANKRGFIKIALGLAKGKKGPDRKEEIKRREIERELAKKYRL